LATIERRLTNDGTIAFRVKVRRKGTPTQTATFTRLTDARKWAQVTEGSVLAGRHFTTAEAKRRTVTDLVERYVQDILPHKSPSSIYMQTLQLKWWASQLGQRVLTDITPALIAEYREKLARGEGKPRGPATQVRYLAALSHAFAVAVREWQWCDDNPVRKARKPKEPRGRVRFLSDDERRRLLAACQTSRNDYLYLLVVLGLATGARKHELQSLRWSDVNLTRGTLTFQQTKNGERRTVPLTGQALALMQEHARVRRIDTTLVFPNATGKKPLSIRGAFVNAVTRAGIVDFTFHDLRHSCASYLAMNGASLLEIADILGHKSLEMVRRYAHLSQAHTTTVVARMNQTIFGGGR
jgi:integrase